MAGPTEVVSTHIGATAPGFIAKPFSRDGGLVLYP
jgi:hypothetical protein